MSSNINGDDALDAFTGLGDTNGLSDDAMNIFGSFTNDAAADSLGGLGSSGFGDISANALGGFGMDLGSFDMAGDSGSGVDLSSMQLINLNDAPLNGGITNQSIGPTDDAAQLMARLLGPGTQQIASQPTPAPTSISETLGINVNALNSLTQHSLGLSENANTAVPQPKPTDTRAGSVSSDEMGDIPLAQLALMPSGQPVSATSTAPPPEPASGVQQNMATLLQSQAAMQTLVNMGNPAMTPHGFNVPIGANPGSMLGLQQASQPGGSMFTMALAEPSLAGFGAGQPQQPAMSFSVQGVGGMVAQLAHGLERAAGGADQPFAARMANSIAPTAGPAPPLGGAAPIIESGMTGVHSTILPDLQHSTSSGATNPSLALTLSRPPVDISKTPLAELETIEDQLCLLLETASKAIRMMTGPRRAGALDDGGLDSSSSKIKPTIKEFMHLVAEVQAGLQLQHKQLTAQGISMHTVAGFQSDVPGFERDLIAWSDVARLLASALSAGLDLSLLST